MRKFIFIFICFIIVFMISNNAISNSSTDSDREVQAKEKRGIFISYIELNRYLKGKDVSTSKKNIDLMIENIINSGFNLIILQVRSFSDAIYESSIYPWSSTVSSSEGVNPGYDVLKYFIKKAHQNNLLLYAWVNPYRVRTTSNVESISDVNPAYKYIGTDTLFISDGIFYNPAKEEVEELIVTGVSEIVEKYKVDGILFDDYFYPSNEVDVKQYNDYILNHDYLSKNEYHLMIINKMIKRVHKVCEEHDVLFGVSPDGNVSNNYEKVFADVKTWVSNGSYIDFIMPQIYYGFYNETKAFYDVSREWDEMITDSSIELIVALAFYKVGKIDEYAKSGSMEWVLNNDIIMREIVMSRNLKHYSGFALFRYDNLFNTSLYTDTSVLEIENMNKILK